MNTNHLPLIHRRLGLTFAGVAGLLLVICGPAATFAQSDNLDAILARIEFDNANDPAEFGEALASLEVGDLAQLCDMLVAPGIGDDTKLRMALNGVTWYVASQGTPEQRVRVIKALGAGLLADLPTTVKTFFIARLQLVGDATAVPYLAECLHDAALCEPAARALVAINRPQAATALRDALSAADDAQRVGLINALAALHDAEAATLFEAELDTQDDGIRAAALWALAELGEPARLPAVRSHLDTLVVPGEAAALLLRYAQRGAEVGENTFAAELFRELLNDEAAAADPSTPCAALHGLAAAEGPACLDDILAMMTDESADRRACATDAAISLPGREATQALAQRLTSPGDAPAVRVAIIDVLARRGDEDGLPAVTQALRDKDPQVRLAAIAGVVTLGGQMGGNSLVTFLHTGPSDDEVQAVRQAMLRIPGESFDRHLGAAVDHTPPPVRATLLDVLADRRARTQLDRMYTQVADADEAVSIAALRGVEMLGDESRTDKLLSLLAGTESEARREAIEHALAATCSRAADHTAGAAPLLAALQPDKLEQYCSLLRVLGHVGGDETMAALRTATTDTREEAREAAYKALGNWPDPAATEDVLHLAEQAEDTRHHVLALRAFARLVPLDNMRTAEQMLSLYDTGLKIARRPDERKMLLARVGDVHDPATLAVLEPYLADEELRGEAAMALLAVADGLLPGGWAEARVAIDKVLAAAPADNVRQRATETGQRVAEYEDFVTDWRVAGPYFSEGKAGHELLDVVFPPEESAATIEWRQQPVSDGGDFWRIDLSRNDGIAGDNRVAYLATRLHSPQEQDARFELGSDDGIKVWLNGEVVLNNNALRSCGRGDDKVAVTLRQGWNDVLLKVSNDGGAWAATLRVRDPQGGHLDGVRTAADGHD